jgi:hypothetical protein
MEAVSGRDYVVRPAEAGDRGFVCATWLRDYGEHSQFARKINPPEYRFFHGLAIDRILTRASVLVACDPQDASVLYGFIVYEPGLLAYAYVKRAFRRMGIFRELLRESGLGTDFSFSHLTYSGEGLWRNWYPRAKYNPYAI